ncbi:MAG: hypothetical protein KAJ40_07845 [Alphaproteobacteria bacterium]|nr:hypothetical protein [Alphaproteobacteria bacterium]
MQQAQAYEDRIDELEKKKLIYQEKAGRTEMPKHSFEEMFELSMMLLSNPYKIWTSSQFNLQRTVLKLVFSERLTYCRNEGFRTPKTALPFKALGGFFSHSKKVVRLGGLEPPRPTVNGFSYQLRFSSP